MKSSDQDSRGAKPARLLRRLATCLTPVRSTGRVDNAETIFEELRALRTDLEATRRESTLLRREMASARGQMEVALDELEFLRSRSAVYLGGGVALTYMADGRPIYVNSLDYGGPANLINGGRYEDDNLAVLFSFVKPDTVFLDIGGNLGFFSLQVAARTPHGRAHCFEPHPHLAKLARMSAYINGLTGWDGVSGRIICHQIAVGDTPGEAPFLYPDGHLGGGFMAHGYPEAQVVANVVNLDAFFPSSFICDLVKVDVEGAELSVFRSMSALIARSPDIKILFEKLVTDAPDDAGVEAFFQERGFALFGVEAGARLRQLAHGELGAFSGYVLAARDGALAELNRARVEIFPDQMQKGPNVAPADGGAVRADPHETLYFGPYWELRQGSYRITVEGAFEGECELSVLSHRARERARFRLRQTSSSHHLDWPCDTPGVEFIIRAGERGATARLDHIRLERA